ncbi:hypothetical protein, partial [Actinophytocola sp.]|uniref:hypothetical protein n=1 Tax=Actinophytocola sp. TaxID=1872138 RepID=UPI002D7EF3D9
MTSFPAALRECVLCFGPYGFRATWHHLVVNAGIPRRLEDDPESLVRAVAELAEARPFVAGVLRGGARRRPPDGERLAAPTGGIGPRGYPGRRGGGWRWRSGI